MPLTAEQVEVLKQNLEIAKLHGDVEAALRLDRVARGEEDLATGPEAAASEPTPEPEPTPTPSAPETTGASARRTLSR
jgi:capsular polysaccharide biosynthesis protein